MQPDDLDAWQSNSHGVGRDEIVIGHYGRMHRPTRRGKRRIE